VRSSWVPAGSRDSKPAGRQHTARCADRRPPAGHKGSVEWVELAFGLEFEDSAGHVTLGQRHFTQELVSQRQRRVHLEGLAGLDSSLVRELTAEKKPAGEEIRFSRVGGEAVLRGKGVARVVEAPTFS